MAGEYYVYAHLSPKSLTPFYIGKGKGGRYKSQRRRNFLWNRFAKKIGFIPIKLVDGLTDEQACEIEKQYIKKYGFLMSGGSLVNIAEGGNGGATGVVWNKGKRGVYSEEYRKKISEGKKGKQLSPEAKPKVLAGLRKAAEASLKSRTHKVRCLVTGQVWENRNECMKSLGLNLKVYSQRIFKNKEIKGNHLQLIKN